MLLCEGASAARKFSMVWSENTTPQPKVSSGRLRSYTSTLAEGKASAVSWGCDLSYDYVKINADYTSLTVAAPDGTVARDDRLTNYSPGFKRALLVEALSYISKFTNKRAVVKYGGAAMVKDSLKASFANDINLLRSAGLLPIVVHGGGPRSRTPWRRSATARASSSTACA